MNRKLAFVAALAAAALAGPVAHADPVTVHYAGHVAGYDGAGLVPVYPLGTAFSYTLSFDRNFGGANVNLATWNHNHDFGTVTRR